MQITHSTVSKAEALKTVAAELGVSREQVMAIGDNANDVDMLRWAGIGVAILFAAWRRFPGTSELESPPALQPTPGSDDP